MGLPEGASVATEGLRRHARLLGHGSVLERAIGQDNGTGQPPRALGDDLASRIRAVADKLENGKVPVAAWGAPGATVSPGGPSGRNPVLVPGEAPAELQRFREAYFAAHEAAVSRLNQLADLYDDVSIALRNTADNYDDMEGE